MSLRPQIFVWLFICCFLQRMETAHAQVTNADFAEGEAKYERSEWAGAATNFSNAIQAGYELYRSYCDRAYARSKLADRTGALADCAEAIKLYPNSADPFFGARAFL